MKKIILLSLSLLMCLAVFSCQAPEHKECEILEIKTNRYSDSVVKHLDNISETVIKHIDESKLGSEKEIVFARKTFRIQYLESYEYIVGDIKAERYTIVGSSKDDSSVMLLPDGSLYAILNEPIFSLDIKKDDDADTVKSKLVKAFEPYIKLSDFTFCDVTPSLQIKDAGSFGNYLFVFGNKIGDIITDDYISICIGENGSVSPVWFKSNVRAEGYFSGIAAKSTDNDRLLSLKSKLEEIYNSGSCSLRDFEIQSKVLTVYNDKPYVYYTIGVHYTDSDKVERSESCDFLIEY